MVSRCTGAVYQRVSAVVGLLTIVTTMCLLEDNAGHHYMQASGAVVVTSAHFLNRHLCRTCTVC